MEGPILMTRSSMWRSQKILPFWVIPGDLVLLMTMEIGVFRQVKIALLVLKGRNEKTMVDDE